MYLGFNKNDTGVENVVINKIDTSVENVKGESEAVDMDFRASVL